MFEIGDEVTIKIEKDARSWGYNPYPDGTVATIIGFGTIHFGRINNCGCKPGIYTNKSWARVLVGNKEHTESSSRLSLTDKKEHSRRMSLLRKEKASIKDDEMVLRDDGFISDLPPTPFWEWDVVKFKNEEHANERLKIVGIDYGYLGKTTDNGSPWPLYHVGDDGWYRPSTGGDIELVNRGLVWKYHHNEPLVFGTVEQEANFYKAIGRTYEIRNPKSKLYSWTKEEALAAIQKGLAHGFSVSRGLFSGFFGTVHHSVIRYIDEDVGKRVAAETLKGFGLNAL